MTIDAKTPMQTPRDILAELWTSAGGEASALDRVTLTGDEPQLPSSFRIAAAAQVGIAAAGMAAAKGWHWSTQKRWPNCHWFRSRKSARPRQNRGPKAIARWQACACLICRV